VIKENLVLMQQLSRVAWRNGADVHLLPGKVTGFRD
jgi:hypothetical protein